MAQLARAIGSYPIGRRFEPYSWHHLHGSVTQLAACYPCKVKVRDSNSRGSTIWVVSLVVKPQIVALLSGVRFTHFPPITNKNLTFLENSCIIYICKKRKRANLLSRCCLMAKTPAFQAGTPAGSSPVIWSRTQIGLAHSQVRIIPDGCR